MPFFSRKPVTPPRATASMPARPAVAPARPPAPAGGNILSGSAPAIVKPPPAPTPVAAPAAAPAVATAAPSVAAPAAQPNLSTAIGQLKAGNQLGADATMRSTVGLPEIQRPAMPANPTLQDAIARIKAGDRAGGEEIMRRIVGLKKGGKVSSSSTSSKASSVSKRADGIAQKGKTRGRMV